MVSLKRITREKMNSQALQPVLEKGRKHSVCYDLSVVPSDSDFEDKEADVEDEEEEEEDVV